MNQLAAFVWELADLLKLVEKTEVECCGVTPYQGYVLIRLQECGPVAMQELSKQLAVAVSTMTRNIDKLEAKKMVVRVRSGRDARVTEVELTELGKTTAAAINASWNDYFAKVTRSVSPEQHQQILVGLETLLMAVRRSGSCC